MDVEEDPRERISGRYHNQGVSRRDPISGLLRCCHCDGVAFLGPMDRQCLTRAVADQDYGKRDPSALRRLWAEAGDAYTVGYRQLVHYRCGVYLGHDREMQEEDLMVLASREQLTGAMLSSILSHYTVSRGATRRILARLGVPKKERDEMMVKVDEPSDDEIEKSDELSDEELVALGQRIAVHDDVTKALHNHGLYYNEASDRYQRFNAEDVATIHRRLFITPGDLEQFQAHNRDHMPIPEAGDPRVAMHLNYAKLRSLPEYALCERCEEPLLEQRPGLCYRGERVRDPWRYWHHECYAVILQYHQRQARQELESAFEQPQRWRLARISRALGHAPLAEFEAMKGGEPEAFLRHWEERLHL